MLPVTLKSTEPGTLFRGFYMQARDDDYKAIGSFTPNNDAKAHSCKGIRYVIHYYMLLSYQFETEADIKDSILLERGSSRQWEN